MDQEKDFGEERKEAFNLAINNIGLKEAQVVKFLERKEAFLGYKNVDIKGPKFEFFRRG